MRALGKLHWDRGEVTDISIGGISFSTPLELRVGDSVRLSFGSVGREFAIEATVRHVQTESQQDASGAYRIGAMT